MTTVLGMLGGAVLFAMFGWIRLRHGARDGCSGCADPSACATCFRGRNPHRRSETSDADT